MSNAACPDFSARARAVALRTYCRPLDDEGTRFESWDDVVTRSMYDHHAELWARAGGEPDLAELEELAALGRQRKSLVAGRTLWLGGTPYAFDRAACNFNCAYRTVKTVYDLVDVAWLLLNGCGVGFRPQVGTLHGYVRPIPKLTVVPSRRPRDWKGPQQNFETLRDGVWTIKVGDSAAAWARAVGKLFARMDNHVRELVLDGSEVRGPGGRLRGYGWISNGFAPLAAALAAMHDIRNRQAGDLLTELDILDVVNHLGQVLSSRRAAEIALLDATNPREPEFARAKEEYWLRNPHRRQSNNSELFWQKPGRRRLRELMYHADACGGDPAIINADAARRKAPWFEGVNPCAEILLGSFCNLVTSAVPRFGRDFAALERALWLIARANYRQTCVDLRDGVLQPDWHQNNEALRLCGVSLTGLCQAEWLTDYQVRRLRNAAVCGAYSMADELCLPRPKAVTTIKPEGTASKICDTTEGIHRPLGRYVLNWVNFSVHDPLVGLLADAGHRVLDNPTDANNVLVCFPVSYPGVRLDAVGGKDVNLEPAVDQYRRYLRFNRLWADHNVSCTVSYSPGELDPLCEEIHRTWDDGFVAVSLLRRNDPTMTPEQLGHPYLPQVVVARGEFEDYERSLRPVKWDGVTGIYDIDPQECAGGACPVK